MAAERRRVQDNINPEVINLELRDDYLPQWFELHEALGLKRDTLEYLRDTYEKDPSVCMYEATRLWFEQGDPKPSWAQIAYVLRYKLLDPVRADRIERNHGLAEHPHLLERPRFRGERHHITDEEITDIFGKDDNSPFGKLLVEVFDEFFMTPSPYIVSFHIHTLCSPDGTRMIHDKLVRYSRSIDGVLLPLVLHNYFSHYDIDFLVYIIKLFNKAKSLLPHVKKFLDKRSLGDPHLRSIRNLRQNFMVRCVFSYGAPRIDWKFIDEIKQKLRDIFDLQDFPYTLHFIGWSVNPVTLCYQLPLACMNMIRSVLVEYPPNLSNYRIEKVILEVGSAKFPYDLKPSN